MPLSDTLADVLFIVLNSYLVKRRFGLEVAHAEGDAAVLEAVAQNMEETVHIAGIVE